MPARPERDRGEHTHHLRRKTAARRGVEHPLLHRLHFGDGVIAVERANLASDRAAEGRLDRPPCE